MARRKVDNRIKFLLENGASQGYRTMYVLVGDKCRDQVASSLLFFVFIGVGAILALKVRSLLREAKKGPQVAPMSPRMYPHIENIELVPINRGDTRRGTSPKGPLRHARWSISDIQLTTVDN